MNLKCSFLLIIVTGGCIIYSLINIFGGNQVNSFSVVQVDPSKVDWTKIYFENNELVEKGLRTNYFGTKELTRVLIPLLQCSSSPKIINVSSSIGRLEVRHT
jgi:NAD(P)-dependent dehydrogenase (short-subunit alcohol dehydrogenase family)